MTQNQREEIYERICCCISDLTDDTAQLMNGLVANSFAVENAAEIYDRLIGICNSIEDIQKDEECLFYDEE